MKCPKCEKEGMKSTVIEGLSMETCAYFTPFYDEDGIRHHHDGNTITTSYTCSNGHSWSEKSNMKCWCGWPESGTYVEVKDE